MTRPASIAATTRCFCSSISDDRVRLDGQLARLTGRFRFTRSAGTAGPIRRFDAVSLWLVDARGASYRIVGADQAAVGGPSAAGFRRIHRGVLVGSGALNNRPLTLLLEFTELPDGTATSELIAARVDLPFTAERSNRGSSPDYGGRRSP